MNKFFDIKRTRMTDDAAFRHTPVQPGKTALIFILVYFVSGLLSSIIPGIVSSIYTMSKVVKSGLWTEYTAAASAADAVGAEEALIKISEYALNIQAPWWQTAVELFATAIMAGGAIFYCLKKEKRPFKSLGLRGGKSAVSECALGLGIGVLITTMIAGFSFATTSLSFTFNNSFSWAFILLIPACLVSAIADEIFWRGYLMTSLARDTTPLKSIFIMAIIYAVFHISFNPILMVNAFIFAFFMGVYVFKRGSIWGASIINFVWTYATAVIFGSHVPGINNAPSLLTAVFVRLDSISGGELYGFFGGLSFTLILVISISLLLLTKTKKTEISEFTIDYFA